ncbi:MAG: hypothetical protein ACI89L_001997 [Phycisphaerales bacterium]|jgi:hypothetical protein
MKSTQTMLRGLFRAIAPLLAVTLTLGCASNEPALTPPGMLIGPYDTRDGEVLWALVPLANESGTSAVDPLAVSDAVVAAAQEIRGVRCLPVNRVIETMRAMGLTQGVRSEAEARALAKRLGVEGILVGTITAWDPYEPPTIGLSLAFFPATVNSAADIDPRQLTRASTDAGGQPQTNFSSRQPVVISEHLDARSHEVQLRLKQFAQGRSDEGSAYGWRIYLASMDLYTNFAAYELVGKLLQEEWLRLARESTRQAVGGP